MSRSYLAVPISTIRLLDKQGVYPCISSSPPQCVSNLRPSSNGPVRWPRGRGVDAPKEIASDILSSAEPFLPASAREKGDRGGEHVIPFLSSPAVGARGG